MKKPKCLLLIDDEPSIRLVVQTCLENLGGWIVLPAASAREGLVKAETHQPDAILLDVMMPEMDGIAFLKQLQANFAINSIPVILITAKAGMTEPERYRSVGAIGAIAKPFNPFTLAEQVASFLDWNLEQPV